MSLDTLFFRSPPQLPAQLQWKFAQEPALLAWSIRARNYNTFVANLMLAFMLTLTIAVAYLIYEPPSRSEDVLLDLTAYICIFSSLGLMVFSMTHQKMKFAYRLTKSGIEYCKWKDFPEWQVTLLRGLAFLTVIIFLAFVLYNPDFLLQALIGSGGMGLTFLSMANSKSFRDMHTQYHYYAFRWSEITQLTIATNREVVDLDYVVVMEGDDDETRWNLNVFCQAKQKDLVAEIIRPFLTPGTPFVRAKVNIL